MESKLKAIVVEASRALALLDAARLRELALSCEALNRQVGQAQHLGERGVRDARWCDDLVREARAAKGDMAVFGRVLEATRANLNVMRRLRAMRLGELEYKAPCGGGSWPAESRQAECGDGHD